MNSRLTQRNALRNGATRRPGPRILGLATSIAFSLPLFLTAIGCSDDDKPTSPTAETDFAPVLTDFAEHVVVGTYDDLAASAARLVARAEELEQDPTQARLDAVATAWLETRAPWESSEAFLFGPVAFLSIDPSLDSWPVDRQQLSDVLASQLELTKDTVAEGLGPALRGFHAAEYLVFQDGLVRDVAELTQRELEYLVATSQVMADDAALLRDSWTGSYAEQFRRAGQSGSPYVTQRDAVLEIVEGMIGICDEVANGKIADPFDEQDTRLVESQFSWNSLTDFQNNIRSVKNAYTGGYHLGSDGTGLDEFVKEADESLDARVKSEIDAAIAAVGAIPEPFRNNLDRASEIEAAQSAIDDLRDTLELLVKPLLVSL
ncbi:MAG: peptidase M75 [Candidatus Eisenbacteria bacterium]|uniref:Peptidase M75 n=1 Tax=Eiseniibacteriota bacterium TaxID=2212470 RepID=A0A956NDK1_UNCEI|nr:peptidase M75 [Candidatus Eisenbacteria bacterium]MCB9466053.1 peptidase M75 [Candidatus Eisenbacteria bacterium]